jgi:glycosyltransferase involved in cell wall biosynthesis
MARPAFSFLGDVPALAEAMARLIADKSLANKLGLAGQEQVKRKFRQERIWEELYRAYFTVLQMKEPRSSLIPYTEKSSSFVAGSNE